MHTQNLVLDPATDSENVALQGFVVNSHAGPLHISVFGFDPVPINATP
jgi:hypothetical protein